MQQKKIEIGLVYSARVGGTFLPVRIDKSLGHGRFEGATLPGDKMVKIATNAVKGAGQTMDQWTASQKPKTEPAAAEPTAAAGKPAKSKGAKPAGTRKPSGLDCAAAVLAEAGKPMNTGDMVKRMLDTGMWKTGGKTPAATIYAAIITEIAKKGAASRFRKVERGMFELTAAGVAAVTAAGKEAK